MLDTFAGLGVDSFDLTQTDIDGNLRSFVPAQRLQPLRHWVTSFLESAIMRQHNVIVRPRGGTAELVQLDDLSEAALERFGHTAFLIVATSARNYQAWVAIRECDADFSRRLRLGSGADPSASGATRIAGSINFKRKYAPDFPTVRISGMNPNRATSREELEALGLIAPAAVKPAGLNWHVPQRSRAKQWPSYERCLRNAPPAHSGVKADVSRADFTFCLLAIDWGWSVADTCQRLLEVSSKARANGEAYAKRTAQRAADAVQRRIARASSDARSSELRRLFRSNRPGFGGLQTGVAGWKGRGKN
jgi:hypothetical protein